MIKSSAFVFVLAAIGVAAPAQVWLPCTNSASNLCFPGGNVGVGTMFPGERLHVADGNVLLEGGGETAIKVKRDVTFNGGASGTSQNPIFELGRIVQAGDGDPEFRFLYSDDAHPVGRSVFELDRKGIVASVRQDRGSHFEGFLGNTDPEPVFRLNSFPNMRLEMGAGGSAPVDVAIQRSSVNTLSLSTAGTERLRVNSSGVRATNGYVQLDTSAGQPPDADCSAADHVGRMKIDAASAVLYVCTAKGWGTLHMAEGPGRSRAVR